MQGFLANISIIDHDYYESRFSTINLRDNKCYIDLEYSILHSILADLFEQIDLNTRPTLNELINIKLFYSTNKKDIVLLQRSLMLNIYQEGNCCRTGSDKQAEQ
ncbi:unnamed protein product [Rotaria sp. Silwood2]|nr:unnamed protein product [Rotaria sp. Silwood2]CAF4067026.1 unnamed protein product [Rotaria sp. Silwood2]CAF4736216.1 unnamed protein product [Rotaria sp. Silwood2]